MVTVGFEMITNETEPWWDQTYSKPITILIEWEPMMDLELINDRLHLFQRKSNDNALFVFTTNGVADYMDANNQ